MNCKSYQNLSVAEKIEFVGKAVHLIQNDEEFFNGVNAWMWAAEKHGAFKNVKINPPTENVTA